MRVWIRDPKTKQQSPTLTLLVVTTLACLAKLLVSGLTINGVALGDFSGTDFAAAVAAVGALYAQRKWTASKYADPVAPHAPAPAEGGPPVEGPSQ